MVPSSFGHYGPRLAPYLAIAVVAISTAGMVHLPEPQSMLVRSVGCVVSVLIGGNLATVEVNPYGIDPILRSQVGLPDVTAGDSLLAAGSGVIVDAAGGVVVTNDHVIDGARSVAVDLSDGRRLVAQVVGRDSAIDLAVLRVPTGDLCALPFAEEGPAIGQTVFAIGNPYGLGHTVTEGIVSSLHRNNLRLARYEDFVQTDALLYPGGSGGALINQAGELVGINTAIMGPNAAAVGIGFAIPAPLVRHIVDLIVEHGHVFHRPSGVRVEDAAAADGKGENAVLVTTVVPGSAATRAELRIGDRIVAILGRPVRSARQFRNEIGIRPGRSVSIGVLREGARIEVALDVPI